jgi:hypothetical protein
LRLQLIRAALLFAVGLAASLPATAASAEPVEGRFTAEVGGYQDTTATSVLTPSVAASVALPDSGVELSGGYLVDLVTTASPDVVATASPRWEEARHGGHLGFRYQPGRFGFTARASASYSPDYLSAGGGVTALFETEDRMSTFWVGPSYYRDIAGRTGTPWSTFSRTLDKIGLGAGWTGVLDRSTLLSILGDGAYETGDPSKPYRYVPMFTADAAEGIEAGASVSDVARARSTTRPLEQLPLTRLRGSASARLAWRSPPVTLRLEERIYADSWRLLATTTDARLPVDAHERLRLWPHVRLHAQTGVSFWELAYVANGPEDLPALRTGDRELGPLVNVGAGGGARVAIGDAEALDDVALSLAGLGTFTQFFETLYLSHRLSVLVTLGFEAVW